MKHVYFPIIAATMAHPNNWAVAKLWGEKVFINNFLLLNPVKGFTLANADIFILSFLRKSDMWFKFISIFTLSFSHSLYILIPTGLFALVHDTYQYCFFESVKQSVRSLL